MSKTQRKEPQLQHPQWNRGGNGVSLVRFDPEKLKELPRGRNCCFYFSWRGDGGYAIRNYTCTGGSPKRDDCAGNHHPKLHPTRGDVIDAITDELYFPRDTHPPLTDPVGWCHLIKKHCGPKGLVE